MVAEQLVGAGLGVVDVHVDGVVDEVTDAEGDGQEEHLARVVDQVRQDLRAEVEEVDRRRQARYRAVQQRRRDVAELPRVLRTNATFANEAIIITILIKLEVWKLGCKNRISSSLNCRPGAQDERQERIITQLTLGS